MSDRTTLSHVIKALTVAVRDCLGVEENDRDIEEGYTRPSFFIEVQDIQDSELTDEYTWEDYTMDIYYFAPERETGYIDLLHARENLSKLLRDEIVTDTGTGFSCNDVEHRLEKRDKTLITTFTLTIVQKIADEGVEPLIEELAVSYPRSKNVEKTKDSNLQVDDEDLI